MRLLTREQLPVGLRDIAEGFLRIGVGMEQIAFRLTAAFQNETIVIDLVVAALRKGYQILSLAGPALGAEDNVVDVEPSVLRFSFAMLTEVAVTRMDEGPDVFVAIVRPLRIEALIFAYGWIFQSMGIEGACLEDELGDGQDGSDEADLLMMGVELGTYCWGETLFTPAVAAVVEPRSPVACLSLAPVAAILPPPVHALRDVVADGDFGDVVNPAVRVGHGTTKDRASPIDPVSERLNVVGGVRGQPDRERSIAHDLGLTVL